MSTLSPTPSTTTTSTTGTTGTTGPAHRTGTTGTPPSGAAARPSYDAIPAGRLVSVELRKMFDTRSGFWLMASIAITAVLAVGATILFAPDSELSWAAFAQGVGIPMAVLLPIMAILSVTSEWSQRTGLTTFTLVPHRGRVVALKGLVAVAVGAVSIALALAVGALGNLLGAAINGVDPVWDIPAGTFLTLVLANVLNLLVGFMLGVLVRSSAGAIVGYFVYSFVLPTLSMLLAASQDWFRDLQQWVDFNYAQSSLYDGSLSSTEWAHLGVTTLLWLVIPLAIGIRLVVRSEVK